MRKRGAGAPMTAARRLRAARREIAAATISPARLLALQAFDTAYRTGSFKAAAHALNLTPSAISHRIRNLEQALEAPLFTRAHQAVRPTAAGISLALATGRAFAELARANGSARRVSGRQRLRLKVFPLFASEWLIPRLAGFVARHPGVDLAIETSSRVVDFDVETFDAGISVGQGPFDGLDAHHLADLRSTPIAAPALVGRLKLRTPADLRRATLVHVTTFPEAWPQWLETAGVPGLKPRQTIAVDSFVAAIQAAEQGAGVALGMDLFVSSHEQQGTIRTLFPIHAPAGAYWLLHPTALRRNRAMITFKKWLLDELSKEQF